jgi:hypothetical protein
MTLQNSFPLFLFFYFLLLISFSEQRNVTNYIFSYFSRERRVTLDANLENASSRHANGEYVIA